MPLNFNIFGGGVKNILQLEISNEFENLNVNKKTIDNLYGEIIIQLVNSNSLAKISQLYYESIQNDSKIIKLVDPSSLDQNVRNEIKSANPTAYEIYVSVHQLRVIDEELFDVFSQIIKIFDDYNDPSMNALRSEILKLHKSSYHLQLKLLFMECQKVSKIITQNDPKLILNMTNLIAHFNKKIEIFDKLIDLKRKQCEEVETK